MALACSGEVALAFSGEEGIGLSVLIIGDPMSNTLSLNYNNRMYGWTLIAIKRVDERGYDVGDNIIYGKVFKKPLWWVSSTSSLPSSNLPPSSWSSIII